MYRRHACRTLLPVVAAGLVALAPGVSAQDESGERRRPDRKPGIGERGPGDDKRPRRAQVRPQVRPQDEPPAPMQVAGGQLYIVTGSTVRKLDAKTLEEESTAVIQTPIDAERQTKAKEKFMERFDKDGDGFVREDEVKNPAIITRFDRDGDGAISLDEIPTPQTMMRRPTGPVTLLVVEHEEGSDLYVYRDGWLYRYDTADLTLQAQNEIAPKRAPERPPARDRQDRQDKQDKRDRRDKRKEGRKPKDAPDPPPPPELPDEPVRF